MSFPESLGPVNVLCCITNGTLSMWWRFQTSTSGNYPGLSGWAQWVNWALKAENCLQLGGEKEGRREKPQREDQQIACRRTDAQLLFWAVAATHKAWQENQDPQLQGTTFGQQPKWVQRWILPEIFRKKHSPANCFILVPWDPFWDSNM